MTKLTTKKSTSRLNFLGLPRFLLLLTAVFGLLIGALLMALIYASIPPKKVLATPSETINLGSFQYELSGNSLVKLHNESTEKLQAFLEHESATSGCPTSAPGTEVVTAHTTDRAQVLLGYGCGDSRAPMFAVLRDGAWQTISPTNHFNTFNIPECAYVDQYAISSQIAPVCFTGTYAQPAYHVR